MYRWTVHLKGTPNVDLWGTAVVAGHKIYYFGGATATDLVTNEDRTDVQVFNTVSLRWTKFPPPPPGGECSPAVPPRLYGNVAALIGDTIYLWGGYTPLPEEVYFPFIPGPRYYYDSHNYRIQPSNVLYAFDVATHRWSRPDVSGTVPEPRGAWVVGKVMFIHGGSEWDPNIMTYQTTLTYHTDPHIVHKLDTAKMVWTLINTRGTPPVETLPSATVIGTKMFDFGKMWEDFGGCRRQPITVFDTETDRWLRCPSGERLPERLLPRSPSAFVCNEEPFGKNRTFDDNYYLKYHCGLWRLDPETFSWKKVELKGKGPSQMYFRYSCMVGDRIILFGRPHFPNTKDRHLTSHIVDLSPSLWEDLHIVDLSPSLRTLCELAVVKYRVEQWELPRHVRSELAAMTTNSNR